MPRAKCDVWHHVYSCDKDGNRAAEPVKKREFICCSYCKMIRKHNTTRFKEHLIVCPGEVPQSVRDKFSEEMFAINKASNALSARKQLFDKLATNSEAFLKLSNDGALVPVITQHGDKDGNQTSCKADNKAEDQTRGIGRKRHDVWQHGFSADEEGNPSTERKMIKCHYCSYLRKHNTTRFKQHLITCEGSVPEAVRKQYRKEIYLLYGKIIPTKDSKEGTAGPKLDEYDELHHNWLNKVGSHSELNNSSKELIKNILNELKDCHVRQKVEAQAEIRQLKEKNSELTVMLSTSNSFELKMMKNLAKKVIKSEMIDDKNMLSESDNETGPTENVEHNGNQSGLSDSPESPSRISKIRLTPSIRQYIYDYYVAHKDSMSKTEIFKHFKHYRLNLPQFRRILEQGRLGIDWSISSAVRSDRNAPLSFDAIQQLVRLAKSDVTLSTSRLAQLTGIHKSRAYNYLRKYGIRRPTSEYQRRLRLHAAGQAYTPYLLEKDRIRILDYQKEYHRKKRQSARTDKSTNEPQVVQSNNLQEVYVRSADGTTIAGREVIRFQDLSTLEEATHSNAQYLILSDDVDIQTIPQDAIREILSSSDGTPVTIQIATSIAADQVVRTSHASCSTTAAHSTQQIDASSASPGKRYSLRTVIHQPTNPDYIYPDS